MALVKTRVRSDGLVRGRASTPAQMAFYPIAVEVNWDCDFWIVFCHSNDQKPIAFSGSGAGNFWTDSSRSNAQKPITFLGMRLGVLDCSSRSDAQHTRLVFRYGLGVLDCSSCFLPAQMRRFRIGGFLRRFL